MNPPDDKTAGSPGTTPRAAHSDQHGTGLPWLRTWRGVYFFVFGCFILWVVLLLALTVGFS